MQLQEARLLVDVPFRIAGAVVGQDGEFVVIGPGAKAGAGHGGQMLDDGGAIHFEKEVFVGLFFLPESLCFLLEFRSGADGDENSAVGLRLE